MKNMIVQAAMLGDSPRTNAFGQAYFAAYGPAVLKHPIAWVELKDRKTKWYPGLRKSYHSLINWGERNLRIEIINKDNFDTDDCDNLRLFHLKVAGRETRKLETWLLQYEEIQQGRGEIIFGYLDNKLVTGSMFIDGKTICVYWTGVYDRNHFDKIRPLTHYPLWLAIQRARARGMKWMELGEIDGDTEKAKSIGFFKSGFATHILQPGEMPC